MKVRDYERRNADTQRDFIAIRIERSTADKFDAICLQNGISKSAMARRLIRQYIDGVEATKRENP